MELVQGGWVLLQSVFYPVIPNCIKEVQFATIFLGTSGGFTENTLNLFKLDIGVDFAVYIAYAIIIGNTADELVGKCVIFGAYYCAHIWVCVRGEFNDLILPVSAENGEE
jgi:ABC-type polysaccharide transport system permease subunit